MKLSKSFFFKVKLIGIAILVAASIIVSSLVFLGIRGNSTNQQATTENHSNPIYSKPSLATPVLVIPPKEKDSKAAKPNSSLIAQQVAISEQSALGHLPYPQADPNLMKMIASYGREQYQRFEFLDPEAARALMKLIYSARDEGIWIVPVSGFRTIEQQKQLFQDQTKRLGSVEAAAKLSAPPGYSEHHTGFAIDLTDGRFPKQDITYEFVNTEAYRWLTRHAKEYGFEMSFPENNSQGVSYEPWHWRFVNSNKAAEIFTKARRLT